MLRYGQLFAGIIFLFEWDLEKTTDSNFISSLIGGILNVEIDADNSVDVAASVVFCSFITSSMFVCYELQLV